MSSVLINTGSRNPELFLTKPLTVLFHTVCTSLEQEWYATTIRKSSCSFFVSEEFEGQVQRKYQAGISSLYESISLVFSSSCLILRNSYYWQELKNTLYEKEWSPYIKKTFNCFGNVIEYLGRYTHKIAISNSRLLNITETAVTFSARGRNPGEPKRRITLTHAEFIRRYLMHVLPSGFQKIRYYGFLNSRMKQKNLKVIFKLQNGRRYKQRFAGLTMAELLKTIWNFDICMCPQCGHPAMKQVERFYAPPS